MPTFSIIIPAFNEAKYLPQLIEAIRKAEAKLGEEVQIIVGDNLSTDDTKAIAESMGAEVVTVEKKQCISAVRNGPVSAAKGKYLVFCDADNVVEDHLLMEIKKAMDSGQYIGGGVRSAVFERESWGIRVTYAPARTMMKLTGLSMFLFFTTKEAFDAVGGFDESLLCAEDYEFAKGLRKYGRTQGKKYCNLKSDRPLLIMSARKFDEFGDWGMVKRPLHFGKILFNNSQVAYELWYRPRR